MQKELPYMPPYKMNILKIAFCPKGAQGPIPYTLYLSFFGSVAAAGFLFVVFLCGKQG